MKCASGDRSMFELVLVAALIGTGIGTATAYGATHRKIHQIHFCDAGELTKELARFDVSLVQSERCLVCSKEIVPDNIGKIIIKDGRYYEICSDDKCMTIYDVASTPLI